MPFMDEPPQLPNHAPLQGQLRLPTLHGGVRLEHDGEGNLFIALNLIREVGVASLAEVIQHDIVQLAGLTSHHLRWIGGSHTFYAFNESGALVELSGSGVQGTITADHRLILRAPKPSPGQN
jgi:hypothetical protein